MTEKEIKEIVDRETRAWDTQDVEILMTVFHPDMVWPWPPHTKAHNPIEWVIDWGRYDTKRWREGWQNLFDTHELVHNIRTIRKIEVSKEGDGAFAVVDIDTFWRSKSGKENRWMGRTCKIYSKVENEWKMTAQVGVLDYDDVSI